MKRNYRWMGALLVVLIPAVLFYCKAGEEKKVSKIVKPGVAVDLTTSDTQNEIAVAIPADFFTLGAEAAEGEEVEVKVVGKPQATMITELETAGVEIDFGGNDADVTFVDAFELQLGTPEQEVTIENQIEFSIPSSDLEKLALPASALPSSNVPLPPSEMLTSLMLKHQEVGLAFLDAWQGLINVIDKDNKLLASGKSQFGYNSEKKELQMAGDFRGVTGFGIRVSFMILYFKTEKAKKETKITIIGQDFTIGTLPDVIEAEITPKVEDLCGNATIDEGETCDKNNFGEKTCKDEGFAGGTLTCSDDCKSYDTTNCTNETADLCGNGKIDDGELCDGTNLGAKTCEDQGDEFTGGTLACKDGCKGFDTTKCTKEEPSKCGNGKLDSGEECDGTNLGTKKTCNDFGDDFISGTLSCSTDCKFDTSKCVLTGGTN